MRGGKGHDDVDQATTLAEVFKGMEIQLTSLVRRPRNGINSWFLS